MLFGDSAQKVKSSSRVHVSQLERSDTGSDNFSDYKIEQSLNLSKHHAQAQINQINLVGSEIRREQSLVVKQDSISEHQQADLELKLDVSQSKEINESISSHGQNQSRIHKLEASIMVSNPADFPNLVPTSKQQLGNSVLESFFYSDDFNKDEQKSRSKVRRRSEQHLQNSYQISDTNQLSQSERKGSLHVDEVFQKVFAAGFKNYKSHLESILASLKFESEEQRDLVEMMDDIKETILKSICEGKELDDNIEVSDTEEFYQPILKKTKILTDSKLKPSHRLLPPLIPKSSDRKRRLLVNNFSSTNNLIKGVPSIEPLDQSQRSMIEEDKQKLKALAQENKLRRLRFIHRQVQVEMQEREEQQRRIQESQQEKSRREMEAFERRRSIQVRMESSKSEKARRKSELIESRKMFFKKIRPRKGKPIYIELEENFKKQEEEADKKKKSILDQIKKINQPIKLETLLDHKEKQEKIQAELQQKRELALLQKQQQLQNSPAQNLYKSKFYMRTIEQENVRKEMEEAKAELKALLQDKQASYARYVKDIHLPSVSFKKQQEMKNLKERLKHPKRESNKVSPGQQMYQLNRSNTSNTQIQNPFSTAQPVHNNSKSRIIPDSGTAKSNINVFRSQSANNGNSIQKPPLGKPPFATPIRSRLTSPIDVSEKKYQDFLRQDRGRMSRPKPNDSLNRSKQFASEVSIGDWKTHLNDSKLSNREQFDKVKQSAKAIEDKALRKMASLHQRFNSTSLTSLASHRSSTQQQSVQGSFGRSERFKHQRERSAQNNNRRNSNQSTEQNTGIAEFQSTEEVNGLLIDAIKAKLALLDKLTQ